VPELIEFGAAGTESARVGTCRSCRPNDAERLFVDFGTRSLETGARDQHFIKAGRG